MTDADDADSSNERTGSPVEDESTVDSDPTGEEVSAVEDDSAVDTQSAETDESPAADGYEPPTPTPQSEALRRQQYYVGIGGGILAGVALMTGLYQRFPDAPVVIPVLAGVFGAGLVLWLVKKSAFPGESEVGDT